MPEIPFSVTLLFLGIILLLLLFPAALLFRAAKTGGSSPLQRRKIFLFSGGALLLWLAFTGILAGRGFFRDFTSLPPRPALLLVPALLAVILLAALPRVRRFIWNAPASWLIYIQTFRVLVEWTLYQLYGAGIVPQQMTFEGMNFDIITGATAPLVGWLVSRGGGASAKIGQLWNVMGLALVLTIMIVSILSMPTPFRVFTDGPANTFIAEFPYIWLPAFVVPSALLFHLWSLGQLRRRELEG